jgi:hypothetical protein
VLKLMSSIATSRVYLSSLFPRFPSIVPRTAEQMLYWLHSGLRLFDVDDVFEHWVGKDQDQDDRQHIDRQ